MGQCFLTLYSCLSDAIAPVDEVDHLHTTTEGDGDSTPLPFKGKGKFSTLGKIFKPWKWRKKKSSEKFTETSEVLERKMSMRRPRQELIEQGVLKELPENGKSAATGDVTHSPDPHITQSASSSWLTNPSTCPETLNVWRKIAPEGERWRRRVGLPSDRLLTIHEEEDDDDEEEEYDGELPQPELEPRSRRCMVGEPSINVIPEGPNSSEEEEEEEEQDLQREDSDSDGPVLYKDENSDEDEEDEPPPSALASRVRRKDTLALKLSNRHAPEKHAREVKSRLTWQSREQWEAIRTQIGSALTRRLSQRPSAEELEQRNILQPKNQVDRQAEVREIKRRLTRKLSERPTVAELQARKILRFHEYVEVTTANDYDRRADKPWTKLTPADKAAIRKELNDFKSSEMEVHEDSRIYTRFHRP
uniref:Phosphatase and actin regulator 4 n=1 Tax=Oncorhynchus tshawytscha TaxID=74940 RepID=A0A8C8CFE4_ONCTS